MKIRLFDSNDVQDVYGVVVPHLDYKKTLTHRELCSERSKEKVLKKTKVKNISKFPKKHGKEKDTGLEL